ncbi:MAG: VanZ family protein [Monoglobaceae bacterium]
MTESIDGMIINALQSIITNVLTALYQPFGFAVILTVLFMFFYLFAKERGFKASFKQWWNSFKTDKSFRKVCFLVFYTAMILFRTLLCRYLWGNPLSNVIGVWGLYDDQGNFTTEAIENFVLFLPFVMLLLWCFHDRIIGESNKFLATLWQSVKITFLFSLSIEFLQLILHLGTFQLSDIFYNTLGGFIGGLFYWIVRAVHNKVKRK